MIRVGIFFGGQSREREISFAGGRTVYDNLDKNIFIPVPLFIDSEGKFILLEWQFLYKGSIRDFYPPTEYYPKGNENFQLYIESLTDYPVDDLISKVGKQIFPHQFSDYFDIAFLALHGPFGEDGNIQSILEWYRIPYTGCGVLPSSIGISKSAQKKFFSNTNFKTADYQIISKDELLKNLPQQFEKVKTALGLPLVIKSPNQGSSLGVSVVFYDNKEIFEDAVLNSLFIKKITAQTWNKFDVQEKEEFARNIGDIRSGIGYPVIINHKICRTPRDLIERLDTDCKNVNEFLIESVNGENEVLFEKYIEGREFSCIVIEDFEGNPIALPPTEIIKYETVFDYRSKYLPGLSRKQTPIDVDYETLLKITREAEIFYQILQCQVYARIDGFLTTKGEVILNDPNTTSGMMPSSFFFHQAAEIGLNPSEFLTYIIYVSLINRKKSGKLLRESENLLQKLDKLLENKAQLAKQKEKVAVILGGFSSERHISIESGRNVYEKLASSTKYKPIPIFLTRIDNELKLYKIPINILLKDNADDIAQKVLKNNFQHPYVKDLRLKCNEIIKKFSSQDSSQIEQYTFERLAKEIKLAFIALHGRPGEDGVLQAELDKWNIAYNGSGPESASKTIDKYLTNEILKKNNILVAKHKLIEKTEWLQNKKTI